MMQLEKRTWTVSEEHKKRFSILIHQVENVLCVLQMSLQASLYVTRWLVFEYIVIGQLYVIF